MKLTKKEKKLLQTVAEAMEEVKDGHPMKDYLDYGDIAEALILLVKVAHK